MLQSAGRFVTTLQQSIRLWAIGTLVVGISWFLLANALRIPLELGLSIGAWTLYFGAIFQGRAFRVYLGRSRHAIWLYIASGIHGLFLIVFIYLWPNYSRALATTTLIGALIFSNIGAELLSIKPHLKTYSVNIIGFIFAATAMILLISTFSELFLKQSTYLYDASTHQQYLFGYGSFATIVASLSFMVMCSERYHEDIARKASIDPLTEIYNRRMLEELGARLVAETYRHDQPACALMIDIDHFKKINDDHGHAIGDIALKSIANVIATSVRSEDIAGRYGGEEFVVLMPQTTAIAADDVAQRICQLIRQLQITKHGNALKTTVSIGIAQYRAGDSLLDFLHRADHALYQAKHEGRDCVRHANISKK
jgi:diguanylate cyclase (GGDEF)-like protein